MPANYPTADPSFSNKSAGGQIQASHVNALQDEVIAIGAALRGTLQHSVTTGNSVIASSNLSIGGLSTLANAVTISTGVLTLGQGQIVFPGTQVASAGANTLDDYEEGSWTPTITGSGGQSGQVYATQVGRYIKVGKLVTCWGRLTLSTLGTVTTNVQIGGLPFTADNVTNLYGGCHINYWANMTASYVFLSGQVLANTTAVTLIGAESATATTGALTQAKLSNTTDLIFCVTYQASA